MTSGRAKVERHGKRKRAKSIAKAMKATKNGETKKNINAVVEVKGQSVQLVAKTSRYGTSAR